MAKHKEKKAPAHHKKHKGMEVEIEIEKTHPSKHKKEHHKKKPIKNKAGKSKVERVMHEFKHHELHSGSKKGPLVKG